MAKLSDAEYKELQAEIRRNVRRIQQILRRMEKKGYVVDLDKPVLKQFQISKKSLRELRRKTITYVQKRTYEVDTETGELTKVKFKKKGTKKKKPSPGGAKRKPKPTPIPIDDIARKIFSIILGYAKQILGTTPHGIEMFKDVESTLIENYKQYRGDYVDFIFGNSLEVNNALDDVAQYNIYDDYAMNNPAYAKEAYNAYDELLSILNGYTGA